MTCQPNSCWICTFKIFTYFVEVWMHHRVFFPCLILRHWLQTSNFLTLFQILVLSYPIKTKMSCRKFLIVNNICNRFGDLTLKICYEHPVFLKSSVQRVFVILIIRFVALIIRSQLTSWFTIFSRQDFWFCEG